jgi:hypothetical protein
MGARLPRPITQVPSSRLPGLKGRCRAQVDHLGSSAFRGVLRKSRQMDGRKTLPPSTPAHLCSRSQLMSQSGPKTADVIGPSSGCYRAATRRGGALTTRYQRDKADGNHVERGHVDVEARLWLGSPSCRRCTSAYSARTLALERRVPVPQTTVYGKGGLLESSGVPQAPNRPGVNTVERIARNRLSFLHHG